MALLWVEKYRPKAIAGFFGEHFKVFVKAMNAYKRGRPILLVGPSGSGKSSSVYAYAQENSIDLVELNASDERNAGSIGAVAGSAIRQHSLFGRKKLLFIDELDGISGREDRGGIQAIQKIVDESIFPVVIAANDVSDAKFKQVRKKSLLINYVPLSFTGMADLLKNICIQENIGIDDGALRRLCRIADGDVRAAINDLQAMSYSDRITLDDVASLGFRERKERIAPALLKIFKTKDPLISLSSFDNIDEDLDELFLWVEENIPVEYEKLLDRCRGFMSLSRADIFRGRIRRRQHYRFMVYCYALLSVGISLAKEEKYSKIHEYKRSSRILKIWIYNQKLAKKRALAMRIKEKSHGSSKKIFKNDLPFISMIASNKKMAKELSLCFRLNDDDLAVLLK